MNDTNEKTNSELQQYRKRQEFLFNLKRKYSVLLELNKNKRCEWILTNFVKKKVLFQVFNLSKDEIKEIQPINRYRCYLYEPDNEELLNLNLIFESHTESIKYENDAEMKKIMLESLAITRKKQMMQLLASKSTLKIPVMLDLTIYGKDPMAPIIFGDKVYELDELTKEQIKLSYERINPISLKGERFNQMLKHSKILRDSYQLEIEQKNKALKHDNSSSVNVRVLQKARAD